MFSGFRILSKNGAEHEIHGRSFVSSSTSRYHNSNNYTVPKRMETNAALTILKLIGGGTYLYTILLNIGTWKSNTLFGLMVLFGILRIIRYAIKMWQDLRKEEIRIARMRSGESPDED